MGRSITFDKNRVLQSCMLAFWKNGYNRTSIRDLQQLTGLSGRSLIHSFGDKQNIFSLCLQQYLLVVEKLTHALINESTGIDSFFETFTRCAPDDIRHYGCFILNSMSGDLEAQKHLNESFHKFENILVNFFTMQLKLKNIPNASSNAKVIFGVFLAGLIRVSIHNDAGKIQIEYKQIKNLLSTWSLNQHSDMNEFKS